jgi:hypothetical protein
VLGVYSRALAQVSVCQSSLMARRLRVRLLDRAGSSWHAYGDSTELPKDRVIDLSEADAAQFLRNRGASRSVEILGWVDDDSDDESRDTHVG